MNIEFSQLVLLALNHALRQEPWASQQLQVHAGKVACIDLSYLCLRMKVTSTGFLESVQDDAVVNVTIQISPTDLPLLLQDQLQDKQRMISYVKLKGDADFAQTISDLSKQVPWDSEQQLSQLFGDIAGKRLADSGKAVVGRLKVTAKNFQENLAEYFLEENPMLTRPKHVGAFSQEVVRSRDDVERLLKRIEKIEKALNNDV